MESAVFSGKTAVNVRECVILKHMQDGVADPEALFVTCHATHQRGNVHSQSFRESECAGFCGGSVEMKIRKERKASSAMRNTKQNAIISHVSVRERKLFSNSAALQEAEETVAMPPLAESHLFEEHCGNGGEAGDGSDDRKGRRSGKEEKIETVGGEVEALISTDGGISSKGEADKEARLYHVFVLLLCLKEVWVQWEVHSKQRLGHTNSKQRLRYSR
ncbi:hypothetical protein CBR_g48725 [Chara braunii]|uniref:Uncharacterized protein n=1 Tax=Chara braunii TaxID=69332 RepID=A0A388K4N4_CHABU|nr:hypothetical protein CBR_g48725 [Chara braunii]|eukprot:GBG64976.1 hypothetical protein CBR_g48725 [Chara braunii]